jgi:mannose-1-phosphate guanylyltransferase/phosphomannomutase
MIKRAMVSGVNSTGVDCADLRVLPAAISRHLLKTHGYDAGFHVGTSESDPEVVQIRFFEQPGIPLTPGLQKEIEKHFTRHELRRVPYADVGAVTYPARVRESYAQDLLSGIDVDAVRARGFRIVVDYSHSAASFVLPLVLGPLGVEEVSAHSFTDRGGGGVLSVDESIDQAKRLVRAIGADLGIVFDRAGERLYLVDEEANAIPVEQTLLLFLSLLASSGRSGKVALPITTTSQADAVLEGSDLEIVRTGASLPELTKVAAGEGFVFGGAVGGGYVFPEFLPAYDAVASLCKLLELLAPVAKPLSELAADLPQPTLVKRDLPCPWALKGLVMRVLAERAQGREIDTLDGIKVFDERGWTQVLPDPDEPVVHLYAEGESLEASEEMLAELQGLVEEIMAGEEAAVRS